ncbi:MAG: efflux RND transporter periplasmic adaptor subunit [Patescibacteria group bacterium]|nr:efflux RND transporter periplasmic adaptor subunit [Patescibacteria group bacterium]
MIKRFFIRRNILIALAFLAILFIGFRVYPSFSSAAREETIEVKRDTIMQRVTASGEIKSEDEVELKFPVSGKLVYLAVEKNEPVKKGSYIASLDKEKLEASLRQAWQDFTAAKAESEKVYDELKRKVDESFDEKIRRTAVDAKQNKAYDSIKKAEQDLKDADLYSPITGVVTKVYVQAGTGITNTTSIVTIANPNNMVFLARVGESDIGDVSIGQEASVALDAFEGKTFKGHVSEIDYAATVNGGKSYLVKIVLEDLTKVKLDMSGDAEIITVSRPDALIIPRSAVQEKNGPTSPGLRGASKKYVEILEGKNTRQKEITTGIKGTGGVVEILSGLDVFEKVIVPKPAK